MVLFYWFRGQTFYQNPILSALFISNELKSRILNYSLLSLIVICPIAYTAYNATPFWSNHHKHYYVVINHLCYINFTNDSYAPIGSPYLFGPADFIDATNLESLRRQDPIPLLMSSSFQFMQLLLHFLVIIPFLVPFIRFARDRDTNMPEVNNLLKRCLIVIGIVFAVNVFTWVFVKVLEPVLPISKFLIDAIEDSRICVGMILAILTMSNWKQILMPWRDDKATKMAWFLKVARKRNSTENTALTNNIIADDSCTRDCG